MTAVALTTFRKQAPTFQRPHPLVRVLAWELRRFRASRSFWLQAFSYFAFLLLLTWLQSMSNQYSRQVANVTIAGTSAWGLLLTLPTTIMLLVLFLPFVSADGVARDLQRRTHELLMTTALPGWAYVWGRYLMGLLISLGMAILLLASLLGMGWLLHLTTPSYPAPEFGAVLLLWGGMVVPAAVLVSSLGFALATLFPRQSTLIKSVILVAWVVGAEVLPLIAFYQAGSTPHATWWYSSWDPTSALTGLVMLAQYSPNITDPMISQTQLQQIILTVENKTPDVSAWLAPHLILVGLSLLLVLVAAFTFKRFRATLSAL